MRVFSKVKWKKFFLTFLLIFTYLKSATYLLMADIFIKNLNWYIVSLLNKILEEKMGVTNLSQKCPLCMMVWFVDTYCCCPFTQARPTLCDPRDCSMPGSLSFTISGSLLRTHVHWVSVAIQPSHPDIFSSRLQSFPASGFFLLIEPMFLASCCQITGASATTSLLPGNIQYWFPLRWTGLIPLQSKGLSRVFSNTTVGKHVFFGAQPSLWSYSHTHTWLLEKS